MPQTASAWNLLSEPKQMCFHKKTDGCLLTEFFHYIPFWEHLAAWDNAALQSTDTHSANIQQLFAKKT